MSEEKKQEKPYWEGIEYSFFAHKNCEYFPCHETKDLENFNCLFCYCPLYALGSKCGGNFKYTDNGIKDCSACLLPHKRKNYGYIMSKYNEIMELAKKNKYQTGKRPFVRHAYICRIKGRLANILESAGFAREVVVKIL